MYHQKAFWASRCWKIPKFSLKQEGRVLSTQVQDEISRDGWGMKLLLPKVSCLNAKQNLSTPHSNTTDRHLWVCEQ